MKKESKPKKEVIEKVKKPSWKQMVEQRLTALENHPVIAGPRGPQGDQGLQGDQGETGPKGEKGSGLFGL